MTLDSSALIAVLFGESGYIDLVDHILEADVVRLGTPTLTETAIVLTARCQAPMRRELSELLRDFGVTLVPFTREHHDAAWRAYERYGRGRHKAGLNFGDCLSYGVAKLADDELLFVGKDFRQTDIRPAR